MPTVLITIGRLPKALDFARSFHAAGWRVVVAEPFARHLTGASRSVAKSLVTPPPSASKRNYQKALLDIIAVEKVDLVLPLSEETLHVAPLHGILPAGVRLFAPPADVLLPLHDKALFPGVATAHGMPVPQTAKLGTAEARTIAASDAYVLKPEFSCAGRGVSLHAAGEALPAETATAMVVQRRLGGAHVSSFTLAHEGRVQVTALYAGTVMAGTVAVAFQRVERPDIAALIEGFVASTRHSGFVSFDFIDDGNGVPHAIECNPRATSGVHFIETADLAPAILAPFSQEVRFRGHGKMQQFYPTLTETQGSILTPRRYRQNVGHLFTSRDVTWDWRDPMPFLTMPVTAFGIIRMAIAQGRSFGQVSTEDISWYEGDTAGV